MLGKESIVEILALTQQTQNDFFESCLLSSTDL